MRVRERDILPVIIYNFLQRAESPHRYDCETHVVVLDTIFDAGVDNNSGVVSVARLHSNQQGIFELRVIQKQLHMIDKILIGCGVVSCGVVWCSV